MSEHTTRAGWFKRGYNLETHKTPARAEASKRNALLGGRPKSAHYRAVAVLNVGASALLPWRMGPDNTPKPGQQWARSLIRRVSERTGRTFWTRGGAAGLIVTRRT
jgi:hypothetical protein